MSFGALNKFIRVIFIWVFAVVLLAAAFFALYRLQTRQETRVDYKIVKECPVDISMDQAYFDA